MPFHDTDLMYTSPVGYLVEDYQKTIKTGQTAEELSAFTVSLMQKSLHEMLRELTLTDLQIRALLERTRRHRLALPSIAILDVNVEDV